MFWGILQLNIFCYCEKRDDFVSGLLKKIYTFGKYNFWTEAAWNLSENLYWELSHLNFDEDFSLMFKVNWESKSQRRQLVIFSEGGA